MAIRHIREVLDLDVVNASETSWITKTFIQAIKTHWEGGQYFGFYDQAFNPGTFGNSSGKRSGWKAVYFMGDAQGTTPSPYDDPDPPGTGNEELGIHPNNNLVHLDHTIDNYGNAAGSHANSGFKHLFHTVQFAKGASVNSLSNFMNGGSNAMTRVAQQDGTYKQSNLKFSDFHGVEKNDVSNTYVYGDSISEQVVSIGAISIGDAASTGGGPGV